MQPPISVWQGCSGYWQSLFIQENLLFLGHAAWQGYLIQGRGIVACDVEVVEATTLDWSRDVVQYRSRYIPAVGVPAYLNSHGLNADFIDRLMETVQTYHPDREILVSICGDGQVEINLLQSLAIAPRDCYRQVRNRWDEFALRSSPERRSEDDR